MAATESVLCGVGETVVVLSGKGGVGKSTTAVQMAFTLRALGHKVGILDVDLCGPSMPRMLGVEDQDVLTTPQGKWMPVFVDKERKLSVVSIAFFLNSKKDAVIWRGPKKNAMIKQLLTSVAWDVDYLIIDTPPGTSDEHLAVMENIRGARVRGAVLVTTPQMLSVDDVTRELTFCRKTELPVLGIIENMAGFVCPNCSVMALTVRSAATCWRLAVVRPSPPGLLCPSWVACPWSPISPGARRLARTSWRPSLSHLSLTYTNPS